MDRRESERSGGKGQTISTGNRNWDDMDRRVDLAFVRGLSFSAIHPSNHDYRFNSSAFGVFLSNHHGRTAIQSDDNWFFCLLWLPCRPYSMFSPPMAPLARVHWHPETTPLLDHPPTAKHLSRSTRFFCAFGAFVYLCLAMLGDHSTMTESVQY
jgi:hypothetical protein